MKIVIAGGSGFLGRPLAAALAADGHDVVTLTARRRPARAARRVARRGLEPRRQHRPVGGGDRRRRRRRQPGRRVDRRPALERRAEAADPRQPRARDAQPRRGDRRRADAPPPVFVSGSAVGYYGPRGDESRHGGHAARQRFPRATVCVQWEAEAMRAAVRRTRVVCIRTGLVLERDGGALPQMLPPFRFGVGGPVGSGRQYWPWIHRADWIALVQWAIRDAGGQPAPINAHRAEPGDQRRVRARARPRDAPPRVHAGARRSRCG